MKELASYRIRVYGKVQGVGFRYFTKLKANELGLLGWVKNEDDGSVLISVSGKKDQVETFIAWCHSGPDTSVVERLDYKRVNSVEEQDFYIKREVEL